ncbi:T9SS type A sorting domain-containing protein [Flavobacterium psychrophilum]
MKKITLLLLLLAVSWQINAQVSVNEGFEGATTPVGWTYSSFSRSTTTPCVGLASVRKNFWSSGLTGSVTSQNYTGVSNGTQINVSFDWKSTEFSVGSGVGINVDVQYSIDNGTSWITFGNVTTTAVTTCATWTGSIPAGTVPNGSDFKLKFNGTRTSGDCYFYLDKIIAIQATATPPNCTVLSTPSNGAVSVNSSILSWAAATGAPTGYKLNVGTTPGGTSVLNNFDVSNVLSYNLGALLAGTTYYVTVIPYNPNGNATGCTESSFTTCSAYTIPYFEGFEAGYTHNTPLTSCLIQESTTGSGVWTANTSFTTYNRTPRTGSWNAFLGYGNEDWIFVPINLVGGTSYTASLFTRQDGATTTDSDVSISYGTAANAVSMTNTVVAATGITNGNYQQIVGSFTPATTGTYYVGVKGKMNSTPFYLSLDDISITVTPACPNPLSLVVSAVTNSAATTTWAATTGNYEYVLDNVATDPAGAGTVLTVETYNALLLAQSTTYYFHVRTVCAGSTYSPWSTVSFTTIATPPSNDNCSTATVLVPGVNFSSNSIVGTNVGATTSVGEVAPGCASYLGGDVWYSVTVPASGSLTFENNTELGGITDTGGAVYSGSCGSLALISCNDSSSLAGNDHPLITVTSRTPGEVLYYRVWEYGNNSFGQFKVSTYDASLSAQSFDMAGFSAYPNPVNEVLNLSYTKEISNVSVHNLLGQEVMAKAVNASQSKIDMSNLSNGTYLVKVTVDGLVKTLKVVKQ